MIPDLVLERFHEEKQEFVRNVFIELKSIGNKTPATAIDQLLRSINKETMNKSSFAGYLIGIQGRKWIFMEYFFYLDEEKKLEIGRLPFNYNHPLLENQPRRPVVRQGKLNEEQQEDLYSGTGFELDAKDDMNDIKAILKWIAKGKRPRDISLMFQQTPYPRSTSYSTLGTIPSSRNTSSNFIQVSHSPISSDIGVGDLLDYEGNQFASDEAFAAESLLLLSDKQNYPQNLPRSTGVMNLEELTGQRRV